MNRCEEVLKHGINKGLKIEKDELYHSDTYLGLEYDEGLKHWKYIKKYKNSRGKTVYVYANSSTHGSIRDIKNIAKSSYADAINASKIAESYRDSGNKKQSDRYDNLNATYTKLGWQYDDKYDALLNKNKASKAIKRDAKKAIKSVSTAISEIHADAVKRGTDFIEKLLNKFK